jgi:hypothetical protein
MNDPIDLNKLLEKSSLNIEHSDDRAIRLKIEAENAKLKQHKEVSIFWLSIVFVLAISGLAIYFLFTNSEQSSKEWARSILSICLSGFIGFSVGKKMNS